MWGTLFFFFEVLWFGSCGPNGNILLFLKIILTINDDTVKLLIPSYALNPRDGFQQFNIDQNSQTSEEVVFGRFPWPRKVHLTF